jgi:hypothetical protein
MPWTIRALQLQAMESERRVDKIRANRLSGEKSPGVVHFCEHAV